MRAWIRTGLAAWMLAGSALSQLPETGQPAPPTPAAVEPDLAEKTKSELESLPALKEALQKQRAAPDLPEALASRFARGQRVTLAELPQGSCRVYAGGGQLLGLGEGGEQGALRPRRLVNHASG